MDYFSVKNFKSLKDIDDIPLKPINIYVGKNSSGKSSLLRLWPLLKQSVMRRTKGPLLFFGEEVDFGSFDEVICNSAEDNTIELSFCFNVKDITRTSIASYPQWLLDGYDDVKFSIRIRKVGDIGAQVSSISIETAGENCSITIDQNGKIEEVKAFDWVLDGDSYECRVSDYMGIIPRISDYDTDRRYRYRRNLKFKHAEDIAISFLSSRMHANTSPETVSTGLNRISFGGSDHILKQLYKSFSGKHFKKALENEGISIASEIRGLILLRDCFALLEVASDYIRDVAFRVKYIKPLRAAAERYYRPQDLQVEEINSDGSNLAVYIRSLSGKEKESFDDWTEESFGFKIRANLSGGHYSLRLKTKMSDREYNVADLGFGYSQILPVIAQIWSSTRKRRSYLHKYKYPVIYAIEQPELHLHPAYQAKVADLMIKAHKVALDNDLDIRFIVETHSDAIVNRIGRKISEKSISNNDVGVVLFDKSDVDNQTECCFSHYSPDGFLENWPYGFFDSEDF